MQINVVYIGFRMQQAGVHTIISDSLVDWLCQYLIISCGGKVVKHLLY